MRRLFLAAVSAAASAMLLGGCASFESSAGDPITGPALENFAVSGRLAMRQGERSDHLGFDWMHAPERDVVLFLDPLGQGLAEIVRDAAGARLTRRDSPTIEALNLGELTERLFGVTLPLGELGEWLRGARGAKGEVQGWRIEITETTPYHERRLPRRLEASRGDVALTLIVDVWGEPD